MTDQTSHEETARWQKQLAAQANNRAWALAEQMARSAEEDEDMLQAAHAAMYFWKIVGQASNRAHAAQLLAHVYALLRLPQPARHYLRQSQPFFLESPCAPWERAFAYLIAANVAAAEADADSYSQWLRQARSAIEALTDAQDREILLATMRVVIAAGPAAH